MRKWRVRYTQSIVYDGRNVCCERARACVRARNKTEPFVRCCCTTRAKTAHAFSFTRDRNQRLAWLYTPHLHEANAVAKEAITVEANLTLRQPWSGSDHSLQQCGTV